jgi:hypothetical protein
MSTITDHQPLPRSLSQLQARQGALLDRLETLGPELKQLARELDEVNAAVEGAVEERALAVVGEELGRHGAGAVWTAALPCIHERLTWAESPPDAGRPAPCFDLHGDLDRGYS